jgi:hypothetical protein
MPFIIHLGEGVDNKTANDFANLIKHDLLKPNTVLIHGISLTKKEIKQCAEAGTSICWCPESNLYLINDTLDVETCLETGTNIILGTDSSMSGSMNLLKEIRKAHRIFPKIPMKEIFKMFTVNAQKALFLPDKYGKLSRETSNFVLIKKYSDDPMENLLDILCPDIELVIYDEKPIYGNAEYLNYFDVPEDEYFYFKIGAVKKFVIGHPEKTVEKISNILGYHKDFPFLPF